MGGYRVLLVDDDFDARECLVDVLSAEGYRVITARDGREALRALRGGDELPAAILLDLSVLWEDLHAALQSDEALRRIPVLALRGDDEPAPAVATVLAKPFGLQRLCDALGSACAGQVRS